MKRLLSIIGAISLVGTSTTSLVACNTPQEYTPKELAKLKEENKVNTKNKEIRDNLEWIAQQEKPFNTVDNKWYYVIWRGKKPGNKNDNWKIIKFKHFELKNGKEFDKVIFDNANWTRLELRNDFGNYFDLYIRYLAHLGLIPLSWRQDKGGNFIKSVYRWNLDTEKPDLIIDNAGNVKVNGE
ncbi:lipoprotein [Spiroplasma sp. Moj]|uniref:lipoprotein n=1 Tax=Spiroplasma sp. Moj TaxID=1922342 RepID=UPI0039EFA230|nr:hypothetical protein [Spiroplasma sp. Moj]